MKKITSLDNISRAVLDVVADNLYKSLKPINNSFFDVVSKREEEYILTKYKEVLFKINPIVSKRFVNDMINLSSTHTSAQYVFPKNVQVILTEYKAYLTSEDFDTVEDYNNLVDQINPLHSLAIEYNCRYKSAVSKFIDNIITELNTYMTLTTDMLECCYTHYNINDTSTTCKYFDISKLRILLLAKLDKYLSTTYPELLCIIWPNISIDYASNKINVTYIPIVWDHNLQYDETSDTVSL